MKVKILLKNIKEGDTITGTHYCIKSLYVSFDEASIYEKIVNHLKNQGCTIDQIEKFCKPKEYKEVISYAFGLNCSNYTFDKVQKFGVLDANIIFAMNEKGYINAKIQVIDKTLPNGKTVKVDAVNSYEQSTHEQEDDVEGWANEPTPIETKAQPEPIKDPFANSLNPADVQDLPF